MVHRVPTRSRWRRTLGSAVLAFALVSGVTGTQIASAQDNPYERGPDPTEQSIEAARGPFATAQTAVWSLVPGFGGGTIYYPTDTSQGTFGAVAIAPGFTADQGTMSWYGPRLASQGFVVFTIDTNGRLDQPDSRGQQLLAALDYLVQSSSVRDRVDASRLGVMGHSMGGGGTLEAANERPALQAAIPLTGWHLQKNWSGVTVPTLVVGAENDGIAPVGSHSEPFYESLPATLDKAYMELDNASHIAPNLPNTTIAKYSFSWLKLFIDNDTRYSQFLCPAPDDNEISEYRETCSYSP